MSGQSHVVHEKQAGLGPFQAWTLRSRIRFALVQTAITAGIVSGLIALVDGVRTLWNGLWFISLMLGIAFVLNGSVRYPRAK